MEKEDVSCAGRSNEVLVRTRMDAAGAPRQEALHLCDGRASLTTNTMFSIAPSSVPSSPKSKDATVEGQRVANDSPKSAAAQGGLWVRARRNNLLLLLIVTPLVLLALVAALLLLQYFVLRARPLTPTQLCPLIPPDIKGAYHVRGAAPSLEEVERRFPQMLEGGAWRPTACRARHRVAIIIPYRDRAAHLPVLLNTLHPFLQRQQIDYRIVVVEQAGTGTFNKGMLMNIGFLEALKMYAFQCFIFHDVDLLPEDDRNLYTCPEQPRHMALAIDVYGYEPITLRIVGGVFAISKAQFQKVNGFSNIFLGWGGEDNDMWNRVKYYGFNVARYPAYIARYKMLPHVKRLPNPKRLEILYTGHKRYKTDGLNSLRYVRKEVNIYHTYTHLLVELSSPN